MAVSLETMRARVDNVTQAGRPLTLRGSPLIIQQQSDPLIVIRQTDHAFLSGFFARELGNEHFSQPEPFASFCLAAAEHDNGWQEWEMAPGVDPKTFAPYTFMTVPTEEHIALYQRGIERVVKVDLYAGLLVANHCVALYDRTRATIPGYSAKYVKAQEQQAANDFVQRLRLQVVRLQVDLRNNALTKAYTEEKLIKANSQRLDALDRLSLHFCLGNSENTTIEGVPVDDRGKEVDWEVRCVGQNQFTIEPYPFRRYPLEFALLARRIPKRRYADENDLLSVLTPASFFNIRYTLRPHSATNTPFVAGA
ncbi:MAG TPA: DUF3891 family protein [Candidatus Limnocylindrales bacterium]|nr:DUF3891 family protein [Candidatus Limnocylindrales bacterium]